MLSQTGTLWHYLGSFLLYTLLAIGMIYAAYWAARRNGGGLLNLARRPASTIQKLEVESMLTLEARKNLYVIRAGQERFLVATSMEGTQFLSRLEAVPEPAAEAAPEAANVVSIPKPWYAQAPESSAADKIGVGGRLVQSVQWLMAARGKS